MRALALSVFALVLSIPLSACGPACDGKNVCAIEGDTANPQVCDGSDFVQCDDDHRGHTIFCGDQPRKAVCGTSGWSFEYVPLAQ